MLNIDDLENRYKKYKLKTYALYITIFALSVFILLLAYLITDYIYNNEKEDDTKKIFTEHNKTTINNKNNLKTGTNISINNPIAVIKDDTNKANSREMNITENQTGENSRDSKIILIPSLDFMKNIQFNISKNSDISNQTTHNKQILDTPIKKEKVIILKDDNITETNSEMKNEKTVDIPVPQKKQTIAIDKKNPEKITINKEISDIQDVIKRFNTNKNPALSLFIAKRYYQINEYESAYNYALTTNNIDSNIEESWIIFSKSLVKLNQKDKAIQTLEQYISFSKSKNAKILLDDIRSGKFK